MDILQTFDSEYLAYDELKLHGASHTERVPLDQKKITKGAGSQTGRFENWNFKKPNKTHKTTKTPPMFHKVEMCELT